MRSIRAPRELLLCVYSTLALLATLIRHSQARATFPRGKAYFKPSLRLQNFICAYLSIHRRAGLAPAVFIYMEFIYHCRGGYYPPAYFFMQKREADSLPYGIDM